MQGGSYQIDVERQFCQIRQFGGFCPDMIRPEPCAPIRAWKGNFPTY